MAEGKLDKMARYIDADMFDARAAEAHRQAGPPAAHPSHVTHARMPALPVQAAPQSSGRTVGARAQEGGARPRAPSGADQPRTAPSEAACAAPGADSTDLQEHTAAHLHGVAADRVVSAPHGHDGGNERQPSGDDPSRNRAPGNAKPPANRRPGTAAANPQRSVAPSTPARATAAKELSVEAALRREYDTELAALKRGRDACKAKLCDDMQHAVQRHDEAMLRLLQELLRQVDADFDALEEALKQRISDAWIARAPVSAKAQRPGGRTPAEQREVNELLKVLRTRRNEARLLLQDSVRSACLHSAGRALGMLMEWHRHIEDELLEQELNPVTMRQRAARTQHAQAHTHRDRARLLLNQNIRAAFEADSASALGLLQELGQTIEEYHQGQMDSLPPR